MRKQKSKKQFAKRFGVYLAATTMIVGSLSQPVAAAQKNTAKSEQGVQRQKNIKAEQTQGELPDKDGNPSGVHWKYDGKARELSFTGNGAPYLDAAKGLAPWMAFQWDVEKVTFGAGVHPVSMKAWFQNFMELEEVAGLPDSLEEASHMFSGCYSLKFISKLPTHLKKADYMFADSNLYNVPELPDSLTDASYMFDGTKIKSVSKLPDGLADAEGMFSRCRYLEKITNLPDHLENVAHMFQGCENLNCLPRVFHFPKTLNDTFFMFGPISHEARKVTTRIPYDNQELKAYDWNFDRRESILYCSVEFQDLQGKVLRNVNIDYGKSLANDEDIPYAPKGYHWDLTKLKNIEENVVMKPVADNNVKQTYDFYGIGTALGSDIHFAQLEYTGQDKADLHELDGRGFQIHPYFKGVYASITVTDKNGTSIFSKKYKGTDYSHNNETKVPMPEGATVEIYHAEPSRLQTNNENLKQSDIKNIYFYVVKNHKLICQESEEQQFKFSGLGDYEFAKLDVAHGHAWIETKYMASGPHCYFGDKVYASIIIKDENSKVIKEKEYIGKQNAPTGIENISLKNGYMITIYHAEPSRLQTNNDQQLKQHQKENTFTYIYKDQKLIEQ